MNIQIYISSLEADLLAPGSPARPRDLWSETLVSYYFGNIDNSSSQTQMKVESFGANCTPKTQKIYNDKG